MAISLGILTQHFQTNPNVLPKTGHLASHRPLTLWLGCSRWNSAKLGGTGCLGREKHYGRDGNQTEPLWISEFAVENHTFISFTSSYVWWLTQLIIQLWFNSHSISDQPGSSTETHSKGCWNSSFLCLPMFNLGHLPLWWCPQSCLWLWGPHEP